MPHAITNGNPGLRKRLIKTERQHRVMELYVSGMSQSAIVGKLKAERPDDKAWHISRGTVQNDLQKAYAWYRQEATIHFGEWLAKELGRAELMLERTMEAFEASKRIKHERLSLTGGGSAVEVIHNNPGDPALSREVREWQNQLLKILSLVSGKSTMPKVVEEPSQHLHLHQEVDYSKIPLEKLQHYERELSQLASEGLTAGSPPDDLPEKSA